MSTEMTVELTKARAALQLIECNAGNWIETVAAVNRLTRIREELEELADDIFDAGFDDSDS